MSRQDISSQASQPARITLPVVRSGEAGIRWPDDVRPCRRLNLHDRRADLDCITVNMLPAISVFCDLRQMCYCVMLSRLFVDIGQIRWVHELHALHTSDCIYEYAR